MAWSTERMWHGTMPLSVQTVKDTGAEATCSPGNLWLIFCLKKWNGKKEQLLVMWGNSATWIFVQLAFWGQYNHRIGWEHDLIPPSFSIPAAKICKTGGEILCALELRALALNFALNNTIIYPIVCVTFHSIFLRFIHVFACVRSSFFVLNAKYYFTVRGTKICLFIPLPMKLG